MRVEECGLIVHPDKGFLAASPDGIVYEAGTGTTGLLDSKCPDTKRDSNITEACDDSGFCCTVSRKLHLKRQHPYYHQCNCDSTAILGQYGVISLYTLPRTVRVRKFTLIQPGKDTMCT